MFLHAGLRMRACSLHKVTAMMAAVRASEAPLLEYIIRSCEGMDFEMENTLGMSLHPSPLSPISPRYPETIL